MTDRAAPALIARVPATEYLDSVADMTSAEAISFGKTPLPPRARRGRTAFTVLELLVVASIISVLVAMLLPSIQNVREKARRVKCMSNLKQIGLAQHLYANDNNGGFYSKRADFTSFWASAPSYPYFPHYFEPLQKYAVKTDILYCPSCLTKNPQNQFFSFPSNIIQPWGSLHNSNVSYGYCAWIWNTASPNTILVFEHPGYQQWNNQIIDTSFVGGAFYIELATRAIYRADGVTVWSPPHADGPTAVPHGTEGSNILFIDGRVNWKTGLIGPFIGNTQVPTDYPYAPPVNPTVHMVY